jgi:hypothetical protein
MRKAFAVSAVIWASCSLFTEQNPSYCISDGQCGSPMVCNVQKHACELQETRPDDPVITAVSPSAAARQGGFEVTITGRNFDKVNQVLFAETAGGNLTVVSSTQLKVTVPPAPGACGLTTLTLRTSEGRAVRDSTHFRYRAANVQLGLAAGGVGSLNNSNNTPGPSLPTRPNGLDVDDLLVGYSGVNSGFSYIGISGSGSFSVGSPIPTTSPLIEIKKLVQVKGIPGNGPSFLVGNLVDKIAMYTTPLNGAGGFMISSDQPVVSAYVDFGVGDFDNDGKDELVVLKSNGASTSVAMYFSNTSGAYTISTTGGPIAIGESGHLGIADFNGDRYSDIVLANKALTGIGVLLNNKAGGFTGPEVYDTPSSANNLIMADMDLDGLTDIVVYGTSTTTNPAVAIYYSDGQGAFNVVNLDSVVGVASQVAVADFDCDGLPDLVVYDGSRIKFYANTGKGTQFGLPVDLGVYGIQSMAAGQFTTDHQNDLALVQAMCSEIPGTGCLRFLTNSSN